MSDYLATFRYEIGGRQVAVSFYNDHDGHEHFYKCFCPESTDIQPFDLRMNHDDNCLCFSDEAPKELQQYAQEIEDALFEFGGPNTSKDPFYEGMSLDEIKAKWNDLNK